MRLLEGKTVLVTGAAGGIGRECALLAAGYGAKVVVNDFGGGPAGGDAGDSAAAQKVADEIRQSGGEAVANAENVASASGARQMVAQALDIYGGLHSVINPAGILRNSMFHKMPEENWDIVIDVHLKGAFNLARAAINHFRDRQEGNFVFFSSTSGLIGLLAQANYAAAKMGVVGLSRILALEGRAKNIRSNAIAPFALTRLIGIDAPKTEAVAREIETVRAHMAQTMRSEQVAQLAVALAAPACDVSGQIFVARGNEVILFSQPRPVQNIARADGWTPETLLEAGFSAMKANFTDLGDTDSVFNWTPL